MLQLKVTQGQGRFIPTPCNAEAVYGRIEAREVVSSSVKFPYFQFKRCAIKYFLIFMKVRN